MAVTNKTTEKKESLPKDLVGSCCGLVYPLVLYHKTTISNVAPKCTNKQDNDQKLQNDQKKDLLLGPSYVTVSLKIIGVANHSTLCCFKEVCLIARGIR